MEIQLKLSKVTEGHRQSLIDNNIDIDGTITSGAFLQSQGFDIGDYVQLKIGEETFYWEVIE